ncbi:MAG: two-component hybrid sensor and regulator [Leptolyngbya sp.]|nr:MAG: two-component hybrid sensor and regulator [Leptolyngbya sp.]
MQPDQQQRIMGYFIEEAKDHLNTIEQGLLNLQATIEDSETVNEVFRAAHSIKGGAAMLGLGSIQQVSHRLEDYFKLLKETPIRVDQKLESLFLKVFDALQELVGQLQGPFGLTEENANVVISAVEPTFGELEKHLSQLAANTPAVSREPISATAFVFSHHSEDAVGELFKGAIPARLREMLQLFKQPDTEVAPRQQLQEICHSLANMGEQYGLSAWCHLIETARQAIAHSENSYRVLAPIVIKDIKQAQEMVIAGRAGDISPGDPLQALLPTVSLTDTIIQSDFADLLAEVDEMDLSEPSDLGLTDFNGTELNFDSNDPDLSSLTDFSLDGLEATEIGLDLGTDLTTQLTEDDFDTHQGPEVGMAELNTLADLFEGEMPDLGMTWQEEEILGDDAELFSATDAAQTFDSSTDFSDLLFDEESPQPASGTSDDELDNLFGDDFSDSLPSNSAIGQESTASSTESSFTNPDEFDDLLTITSPESPNLVSTDLDDVFGLDLAEDLTDSNSLIDLDLELDLETQPQTSSDRDLNELHSGDLELASYDLDNLPESPVIPDPWGELETLEAPGIALGDFALEELALEDNSLDNFLESSLPDESTLHTEAGLETETSLEYEESVAELQPESPEFLVASEQAIPDPWGELQEAPELAIADSADETSALSLSDLDVNLEDFNFDQVEEPLDLTSPSLQFEEEIEENSFGESSNQVLNALFGDLESESPETSDSQQDEAFLNALDLPATDLNEFSDLDLFADTPENDFSPTESASELLLEDETSLDSALFDDALFESEINEETLPINPASDTITEDDFDFGMEVGSTETSEASFDLILDPAETTTTEDVSDLDDLLGAIAFEENPADLLELSTEASSEQALNIMSEGTSDLDDLFGETNSLEEISVAAFNATDTFFQFDQPPTNPPENFENSFDLSLDEIDDIPINDANDLDDLFGEIVLEENPADLLYLSTDGSSEQLDSSSEVSSDLDDLFGEPNSFEESSDNLFDPTEELNLTEEPNFFEESSPNLLNLTDEIIQFDESFSSPANDELLNLEVESEEIFLLEQEEQTEGVFIFENEVATIELEGEHDLTAETSLGFEESLFIGEITPDFEDGFSLDSSLEEIENPFSGELFEVDDLFGEAVASAEQESNSELDDLLGSEEFSFEDMQAEDDLADLLKAEQGLVDLGLDELNSSPDEFLGLEGLVIDELLQENSSSTTESFSDESFSDLGSLLDGDDLAGSGLLGSDLLDNEISPVTSDDFTNTDIFSDLDNLLDDELLGDEFLNDASLNSAIASTASDEFADLDSLLADEASTSENGEFDGLEALLGSGAVLGAVSAAFANGELTDSDAHSTEVFDEFADLESLLGDEIELNSDAGSAIGEAAGSSSDFDDLDDLLKDTEEKLGGVPSVKVVRGSAPPSRRTTRPTRGFSEQTMRVPVKHLDNLSNLVGELVVNRNSLEQDQERLRQSLDNLLYQVQQLSDVGQRMQDLYERSLLESSLLASRKGYRADPFSSNLRQAERIENDSTRSNEVEYDPLEMDRFTGFHSLSQEMIELIVRVRESSSDIEFIVDETEQVTRMFRQVTTQLQEGLTRSRMVPFAQTADRLPRAVRDISMKVGKQAELVIEGRETLIDKMILEQLYDPMTHLVNNAITHGIESPEVRKAAGKPASGRIIIRAFHQGNQTILSVSDDGAGIDVERVKAKAIEKRLISQTEARNISRLDVYDILFHPGFSTKDQADDYSGRGVGMDVVQTSLSEIRGVISTDSTPGKGTTFTIRLPLTLSISKALCCISDRARIAFPMDGVEDMLDMPKERLQTDAEGQSSIIWRDTVLPVRPLAELLGYNRHLGRGNVYGGNQEDDIVSVVVLRSAGNFLALQVDQVLGEQEIVIKQLEGPVPKPIGVAGATVLGDGRIMPIADVLELIDLSMGRIRRDAGGSLWEQSADGMVPEAPAAKVEPMVLIVDDSITVRELLSMTFNKVGYRVEQARDGQEAWEKLRSGLPCDIVFCDIEMPRMDGLELLSRIQKDPNLKPLPIAMLTSRGADRHRQMAATLGASGYFTKPYLEEALLDAAQRMLKGERLLNNG